MYNVCSRKKTKFREARNDTEEAQILSFYYFFHFAIPLKRFRYKIWEYNRPLPGTDIEYSGMTKEVQTQLIEDHFLFKEGDRFLQAANASRYWPSGRGIFHNKEKTFLVWVGEEDHLRIISMQQGGHVGEVNVIIDW